MPLSKCSQPLTRRWPGNSIADAVLSLVCCCKLTKTATTEARTASLVIGRCDRACNRGWVERVCLGHMRRLDEDGAACAAHHKISLSVFHFQFHITRRALPSTICSSLLSEKSPIALLTCSHVREPYLWFLRGHHHHRAARVATITSAQRDPGLQAGVPGLGG